MSSQQSHQVGQLDTSGLVHSDVMIIRLLQIKDKCLGFQDILNDGV